MAVSPEALYMRLGDLVRSLPDLRATMRTPETRDWLAKSYALVASMGDAAEADALRAATSELTADRMGAIQAPEKIIMVVYRALAVAELAAPADMQGAFIPTGKAFDAMRVVGKVLEGASTDVLMVDPYMDEKALFEFALLSREGVTLRLLADRQHHKATLAPAVVRWKSQYGSKRPIEARGAQPRMLHDRLIGIDHAQAWTLTQSFNALAARSPATVIRIDPETAALKLAAYAEMWQGAVAL